MSGPCVDHGVLSPIIWLALMAICLVVGFVAGLFAAGADKDGTAPNPRMARTADDQSSEVQS